MLLNYYSQTKMAKGEKYGYKTAILHLAPFDLSIKNVCPKASKECAAACLNTSGRGQMVSVQNARIKKTNYFSIEFNLSNSDESCGSASNKSALNP